MPTFLILPVIILNEDSLKVRKQKTETEDISPALQPEEEARVRIMAETAKIPWVELQRFFAQGEVVLVKLGLNLVNAAFTVCTCNDHGAETYWERVPCQNSDSDTAL